MLCPSSLAQVCAAFNALRFGIPDFGLSTNSSQGSTDAWPYSPFHTSGRQIVNTKNETVIYAGVNWPGASETMLPEGLQYQSVEFIVSKIKELGMNSIRLTYAIEMIDDIYSHNSSSTLKNTLNAALGSNGTTIFNKIVKNNPQFNENTTRLEVFDAVAAECYKQQIYVHLDNHVSKAEWCCTVVDGNAWFGDTYFNVSNWKRGLAFMADHARHNWPALTSMSLRNELRPPMPGTALVSTYGWPVWYENMIPAANGIHAANPDTLIFFSGLGYDTDLTDVVEGKNLTADGQVFNISSFPYASKIVFELHDYGAVTDTDCSDFTLAINGYSAMDTSSTTTAKNIAPVVMTEFGFGQDGTSYLSPYAQCLRQYLENFEGGPASWLIWSLPGSSYIRYATQDYPEPWGVLNHEWSDYQSEITIKNYTVPFVKATLGK